MNTSTANKLAGELATMIEQLIDKQIALRELARQKLQAMRRCDTEAMFKSSWLEGGLVDEVRALESRRGVLVAQLSAALGLPCGASAKSMSLRMLIPRLDQAAGQRLAGLAGRLREEMLKLAEANRVVRLVCEQMAAHFKMLFATMVQSEHDAPTYSARGEVGPAGGARVLDATG